MANKIKISSLPVLNYLQSKIFPSNIINYIDIDNILLNETEYNICRVIKHHFESNPESGPERVIATEYLYFDDVNQYTEFILRWS